MNANRNRFIATMVSVPILLGGATGCRAKELSPEEKASVEALRVELTAVADDIAEAGEKDRSLSGGLVKALVSARIEILKTNKALLEQRIGAIESSAKITIEVSGSTPDPQLAQQLLEEIKTRKEELDAARSDADRYSGGLVRAMKLSTVATQEQSLAMLSQRYLAAKYGLGVPALSAPEAGSVPKSAAPPPEETLANRPSLPARTGPFGLEAGLSRSEIEAMIGESLVEVEGAAFLYSAKRAPLPHVAFEAYAFLIAPSAGLCQIRAIGKDISSSRHGIQLKSAFSELAESLSDAYGKSETVDRLLPGSIWDEPEDWMRGLQKKERFLQSTWPAAHEPSLKNQIQRIDLVARAKSGDTGYVLLQYSFINDSQCEAEMKQAESNVL